jgi:hypothetical protein
MKEKMSKVSQLHVIFILHYGYKHLSVYPTTKLLGCTTALIYALMLPDP